MQKTITVLAALLAAQLLLAGGISVTEPDLTAPRPDAELLDVDTQTVDRIRITGADDDEVVLAREENAWVLPGTNGFPANEPNVERLLDSVAELRRGFAVGTSANARSRLRVADDEFERRLTFYDSETTLATLYLGTSAGANQVHARTAADDAVYLVDFGAFNAPASSGDWQDNTLLEIPRDTIDAIDVAGLTLNRIVPEGDADAASVASDSDASDEPGSGARNGAAAGGSEPAASWTLAGGTADETVDAGNVDTLAVQLAGLRTGLVLGTEPRESYALDEPALELGVLTTEGERIDLTVATRADADSYVLKSSVRPEYFELATARAEQLVDAASREQLVNTPSEQAPQEAGEPRGGEAASDAPTDTSSSPAAPPAVPR